jgi:hypothetical protein
MRDDTLLYTVMYLDKTIHARPAALLLVSVLKMLVDPTLKTTRATGLVAIPLFYDNFTRQSAFGR